MPSIDPQTRKLLITRRLLRDLGFFTRYFFRQHTGRRFHVAEHHARMFEALTRVAAGECKRLIINVPPRAGKTEVAVKMFIAWSLANNNRAKFIHLSYSDDLALDNSSAIRELVKSDEFQLYFPVKLKVDSDSKKKWWCEAGGGVYATAAGGAITGFGAGTMSRVPVGTGSAADGFGGAIVVDDALKPDDAYSETLRTRVNRRFNGTIASRVNSPDTPIIVIMQRLHEADMSGFLLAGGSGEAWEHLCIPVIDAQGRSIWPEKWSIERLREMERADPYAFAGQYMQRPSPIEGGIIKPDKIEVLPVLPRARIEWVRGWDFAATAGGDYTVGVKLGRLDDGRLVIGDVVRLRAAPDERDAALLNAAKADGYDCRQSIPQDPGQAGVTQARYLVRQLAGYTVHASPETGAKVVRAAPVAAQINVGNVSMLRGEWNAALIGELRLFPNGSHDDQVDALSRAFAELCGSERAQLFFPDPPSLGTAEAMIGEAKADAKRIELSGDVCGRCVSYQDGQCIARGFRVKPADQGCPMFVAAGARAPS